MLSNRVGNFDIIESVLRLRVSLFVSIFLDYITLLVQVLTQKTEKWEWRARSHPIGSGDRQESSSGNHCGSRKR